MTFQYLHEYIFFLFFAKIFIGMIMPDDLTPTTTNICNVGILFAGVAAIVTNSILLGSADGLLFILICHRPLNRLSKNKLTVIYLLASVVWAWVAWSTVHVQ